MATEADQAIVRMRRSFKGVAWESIQHPEDRAALDALKQIPMLDKVVAFIMQHGWERMLYVENISSSVKVSPRQCPRVWYLFSEVNRIFGVDEPPELYISQDPILNAYTYGHEKPFIMLTSSMVDGMNDDELLSVIGHEMGHVLSGHALYTTMVALMRPFVELGLHFVPGGNMAIMALRTALYRWTRASELTGDRFGLLACQDPHTMVSVMMKLAGGATAEHRDPLEFLSQAEAYKNLDSNFLDGLYKLMQITQRSHPLTVVRAAEVMTWSQSRQYINMMTD